MARKPEKKKKEVQTNRQELTVGLGKGKIKGRKSTISDKNVLEFSSRKGKMKKKLFMKKYLTYVYIKDTFKTCIIYL